MTKDKIKLKDLAEDLKIPRQELLGTAREMNLAVRSVQGSVTPEEADKLRRHYEKIRQADKDQKQVIVRHRRNAAPADGAGAKPAPRERAADGGKPQRAPAQRPAKQEPAAAARVISRPEEASPVKVPAARIITPAPQAGTAAQPQPKPEAEAGAQPAPAAAPAARIVAPAPQKDAKPQPRPAQASEQQEDGASPRVRIISRPSPSARCDRPAGGQRDGGQRDGGDSRGPRTRTPGGRPSGGFRSSSMGGGQGGSMGGMDFGGEQPTDTRSKKKRNKGRRSTDFQTSDFGHHQEEHDAPRFRSKGHRKGGKPQSPAPVTQPLKAAKRKLRIAEAIRVSDMAHQMGLKANEIIKVLFNLGIMATINQSIDFDTAQIVAAEFNYEVEKTGFEEKDYLGETEPDKPEDLKPRPPVVTIMGHVDHGKTSLLDAIRKTHVTSGEAGGITQHIGAYHVKTKNGDVVFLDTPGHEAFTAMRARGAQITDLVILVVAADDGVMEQTREAINHARAANVPIIVAINKIDKPGANPDRVMRELSELGLQPEEWGGDTICAKVSAKTHQGLDELLELLALQSEVMELKANPNKPARGHIIEAKLDKGRGPVGTVLIQEGTLHQGDYFVCGTFSGRVRAMFNDQGKKVREAGPSIPVEVQGFAGVPEAGEAFDAVADEKVARRIADARAQKKREQDLASESKVTLETFLASSGDEEQKTLNLVLKADVQGTLEAVQESLKKVSTEKVNVNVVHAGTGAITESDILLASASKAIIIGFNIRPTAKVKAIAAHENVDIRYYDIIYKLVDDVKNAMAGLLAPVEKEVVLGQAEVRQTFSLPKVGTIAGAYVSDGKITRNAGARLMRDGIVIYTGHISSLKRFKDDAKEVVRGNECGVGLENYNDIKVGDIIEAFETVQEAATLE